MSQLQSRGRRAPWWGRWLRATHLTLYRASGGLLGGWMGGPRALLLTTTGRKSGQERTQPLAYFPLEDALALVASNFGSDQPPLWYLNLLASPAARVQVGRERFAVAARVATDAEREFLWPRLVAWMPVFARYQAGTARVIPVVLLRRADASERPTTPRR